LLRHKNDTIPSGDDGENDMRKMLLTTVALLALPTAGHAQTPLQPGGFYIAAEGGANWMFNTSPTSTFTFAGPSSFGNFSSSSNATFNTGFVVGGALGYDFIGLRVEAEGVYRENTGTLAVGGFSAGFNFNEVSIMGNAYYDFLAGSAIVPYIGAGAGVGFINAGALGATRQSTQFAYQAILGVGWNIDSTFRLNLEGRYYGTTAPNFSNQGSLGNTQYNLTYSPQNNNVSAMLSLHMRFGVAAPPPPPPPPPVVSPPSFMVFFDWDRSNLSQQALTTIQQAANAFQAKGSARITATGHTDTSGPESYNMALSLRRANAVKDALVRDGVPAQAISVVGMGEKGLLVQTGDNVREPQNRRVEIVVQ
jgi:OmpA-OmpF porin, OOP family